MLYILILSPQSRYVKCALHLSEKKMRIGLQYANLLPILCAICYTGSEVRNMSCLGNLIWFLFAGLWQGMAWTIAGILWTITVVGIPIGQQCFKFASLSFSPFGREVIYGGGAVSFLLNLIWLMVSGLPIALTAAANGLVLCCTVVGIPWGLQCFKLAKLALMPFGADVIHN